MLPVTPDLPRPGQESVWAYPRPAVAVDGERVVPQPGGLITSAVAGPCKGVPGSRFW